MQTSKSFLVKHSAIRKKISIILLIVFSSINLFSQVTSLWTDTLSKILSVKTDDSNIVNGLYGLTAEETRNLWTYDTALYSDLKLKDEILEISFEKKADSHHYKSFSINWSEIIGNSGRYFGEDADTIGGQLVNMGMHNSYVEMEYRLLVEDPFGNNSIDLRIDITDVNDHASNEFSYFEELTATKEWKPVYWEYYYGVHDFYSDNWYYINNGREFEPSDIVYKGDTITLRGEENIPVDISRICKLEFFIDDGTKAPKGKKVILQLRNIVVGDNQNAEKLTHSKIADSNGNILLTNFAEHSFTPIQDTVMINSDNWNDLEENFTSSTDNLMVHNGLCDIIGSETVHWNGNAKEYSLQTYSDSMSIVFKKLEDDKHSGEVSCTFAEWKNQDISYNPLINNLEGYAVDMTYSNKISFAYKARVNDPNKTNSFSLGINLMDASGRISNSKPTDTLLQATEEWHYVQIAIDTTITDLNSELWWDFKTGRNKNSIGHDLIYRNAIHILSNPVSIPLDYSKIVGLIFAIDNNKNSSVGKEVFLEIKDLIIGDYYFPYSLSDNKISIDEEKVERILEAADHHFSVNADTTDVIAGLRGFIYPDAMSRIETGTNSVSNCGSYYKEIGIDKGILSINCEKTCYLLHQDYISYNIMEWEDSNGDNKIVPFGPAKDSLTGKLINMKDNAVIKAEYRLKNLNPENEIASATISMNLTDINGRTGTSGTISLEAPLSAEWKPLEWHFSSELYDDGSISWWDVPNGRTEDAFIFVDNSPVNLAMLYGYMNLPVDITKIARFNISIDANKSLPSNNLIQLELKNITVGSEVNAYTFPSYGEYSTNMAADLHNDLLFYPNPTSDFIDSNGYATVKNIFGQTVAEGTGRIDLSQLTKGMYIVTIEGKSAELIIE